MMEFQKPHHPGFLEVRKNLTKKRHPEPWSCEFWSINKQFRHDAFVHRILVVPLFFSFRKLPMSFSFRGSFCLFCAVTLCQIGSPVQKACLFSILVGMTSVLLLMRENTQTSGISITSTGVKILNLTPTPSKAPEKRLTKGPPKREGTSPKRVSLDAAVCRFWEGVWD